MSERPVPESDPEDFLDLPSEDLLEEADLDLDLDCDWTTCYIEMRHNSWLPISTLDLLDPLLDLDLDLAVPESEPLLEPDLDLDLDRELDLESSL